MDFILSISWVEVVFSISAGAIQYVLAMMYLKQPRQKAAHSAILLFLLVLLFKVVHIALAQFFPQLWPYDLRDEHTVFLLAVPCFSGALAKWLARCTWFQAVAVAFLSLILNAAAFLCVGFVFFALH